MLETKLKVHKGWGIDIDVNCMQSSDNLIALTNIFQRCLEVSVGNKERIEELPQLLTYWESTLGKYY